MTRRKKNKSAVGQTAVVSVVASVIAPPTAVLRTNTTDTLKTNTPITLHAGTSPIVRAIGSTTSGSIATFPSHRQLYSSNTSSSAVSSRPRSNPASSTVSAATSTSSLKPNGKTAHKSKPRKPVKTIVKYVTKQIHIYPMYPILIVERLQNLDYHISVLTESIGRRPRVYPHGKGVRFVPESNDEYRTIQRYLAKIESAERIAWCSYTLAPGNSLKVNVKVREVEIVKITEDLDKLKLQSGMNPAVAKLKESPPKDVKSSTKDYLPKDIKVSRKDCSPKDGYLSMKDSMSKDANLPALSPVLKENKSVVQAPKDRRLPVAKIPRDIAQNRSYQTTNRS